MSKNRIKISEEKIQKAIDRGELIPHEKIMASYSKEKKERLVEVFRELLSLARQSVSLEVDKSEEKDAEFIRSTFTRWQQLKPEVVEITQTISKGWREKPKNDEPARHYMG